MTNELLVQTINTILKPEGYKKKGLKWLKTSNTDEVSFILQKSLYGDSYYLALNVLINTIVTSKTYKSHLYIRLDSIFSTNINQAFNLENELNEDERLIQIKEIVSKKVIPILHELETIPGIQNIVKKYGNAVLVPTEIQNILKSQTKGAYLPMK